MTTFKPTLSTNTKVPMNSLTHLPGNTSPERSKNSPECTVRERLTASIAPINLKAVQAKNQPMPSLRRETTRPMATARLKAAPKIPPIAYNHQK